MFREQAKEKVDLQELYTVDGFQKVLKGISTKYSSGFRWVHSKIFCWNDFYEVGENDKAFQHAWEIINKALHR